MPEQPPRLAERIIRWLAPGREGDIIVGDLREEFQSRGGSRLWYWREVLSCAAVRLSPHRLTAPDLRQDLHYAVRVLRRNPGYTLTAMLCVALGIGVNSTVFCFVNSLFWEPLRVAQADRVVSIGRTDDDSTCSYRDYQELDRRSAAPGGGLFSGLMAVDDMSTSLDTGGPGGVSQIIMAEAVSANFADVLELQPQAGRWFTPEDERPGADPVVVISDGAWSRRFGRNPTTIGQRVRIGSDWYRVIGVAPGGFVGLSPPHSAEVWLPLLSQAWVRDYLANPGERDRPRVRLVGRLAPGRKLRQAEAEMKTIDAQVLREFPRDNALRGTITMDIAAGASMPAVREFATMMAVMLLSVTGVLLLIACVNVANLLLSRSAVRRREMAVRQALGASRFRLVCQTLSEGLVLAIGGALLGLVLGYWANGLLAHSLPALPHMGTVSLNLRVGWRMTAFAFAAALASALIFSIAPAIEHSRTDVASSLKGESPSRRMRQRDIYVVAQVALSLVLLIAATLLLRGLQHARQVEPGFAMDHRLAARINVSEPEYTPETGRLFLDRVLDRIRAVPGVRSATISYTTPLNMSGSVCAMPDPTARPRRVSSDVIVPGYFDTLSTPIVRGRDFNHRDLPSSPRVVIVNETYARRSWPNTDPIGKSVWLGCDPNRPRTLAQVVGVARDAKYESLDEAPRSYVYRPLAQDWAGFVALIVQTTGNPNDFSAPLRTMLHGMDSNLRVYDIETLEDFATESLWRVRWQAALLAVFGGLGMLLAAVGLYGVVAYAVAQRTREIGVRLAIGAQKADVMWMVLGRGLGLTAIGIGVGLLLGGAVSRTMGGLLYGLSPLDPVSFVLASLAWMLTAMLASYVPARRAMRVDPVVALRWE